MDTTKEIIVSISPPGFDIDIVRVNEDGDYQSFVKTLGGRRTEAEAVELAKQKSRELNIHYREGK